MSRKTPTAVHSASERKYAAAGGDFQEPWGGIYEWRKPGKEELIHGLLKQKQISVIFIAPWWRNGSFQRTPCFRFLHLSLFRSSPVVMNLRWRLQEYCLKNKCQRWDICEKFLVWHFVTKCTGLLNSVKLGLSSQFLESRGPSYISSPMCPECLRKEWRIKTFRLQSTHTRKRPKILPKHQVA